MVQGGRSGSRGELSRWLAENLDFNRRSDTGQVIPPWLSIIRNWRLQHAGAPERRFIIANVASNVERAPAVVDSSTPRVVAANANAK